MSQATSAKPVDFGRAGLLGGALFSGIAVASAIHKGLALKKAAEATWDRIGDYVTQSRIDRILDTARLSRQANVELGAVLNSVPQGLSAMETIASRIVAGVATDQWAIDEELKRREVAARAEMQNVEAGVSSQFGQLGASVGSAFGEGVGFGTQVAGAQQDIQDADTFRAQQAAIFGMQKEQSAAQTGSLQNASAEALLQRDYYLGEWKSLMESNSAIRNSAGTQVGMGLIFGNWFNTPPAMRYGATPGMIPRRQF